MRHRSIAILSLAAAFGCGGLTSIDSSPIDSGTESHCTGDCPDTGLRSDATLPPQSPRDAGGATEGGAVDVSAEASVPTDATTTDASAMDASMTDGCTAINQFSC